MIVDVSGAAQTAVFTALSAAVTGAPVLTDVLEDTQPPYVAVGAIDSENSSESKTGGQFEALTIEVQSIYRGQNRADMLAIMHQVRLALDGQIITAAGVLFSKPRFESSSFAIDDDRVTVVGVQRFDVFAQPSS